MATGTTGDVRRAEMELMSTNAQIGEYFKDAQGFSTGAKQNLGEFTATAEYKLSDMLITRFEARHDISSIPFFNKGTNGRWQGVFRPEDLALYDAKVKQAFSPELARWLEHGRLGEGR